MLKNPQNLPKESSTSTLLKEIRSLITTGQLAPGDRLPSERKLAAQFGVGRAQVRDAISKLEFYGMLKTRPQSGSVVTGSGVNALEGMITDVLNFEANEFCDLVETRVVLEAQAARIAAMRRTTDDIHNMKSALNEYEKKLRSGFPALEADLYFHIQIAEAGKNSVLKSLMMIIIPDILKKFTSLEVCKDDVSYKTLDEHNMILEHIVNQDPELAANAMEIHLQDVIEFSHELRHKDIIDKH